MSEKTDASLIERVALAIEATMWAACELPLDADKLHAKYRKTAQAAIVAMREPTRDMVAAANRNNHPRNIDTWRIMIDAALAR